jgi:hypothetical protein
MNKQENDENKDIISILGNAVPTSETASRLYEEVMLHHEELIKKPEIISKLPFSQPNFVVSKSWSSEDEPDYDTSEERKDK